MNRYEVIVIGAGAAGLACADTLLNAGIKVMVLEARARIGGRAYTLTHRDHPIELGAEFIHGADKEFLKEFENAGLSFIDVGDQRYRSTSGHLVLEKDFWKEIRKATALLNPDLKRDRSLQDFLKIHGHKIKSRFRPLFRGYLEGFHAADLSLMSEKSLAGLEGEKPEDINGSEMFRPLTGYKSLFEHWLGSHGDIDKWLQLEAPVQKINWSEGSVTVTGKPFSSLKSRLVIVTVPLGVLKDQDPLFPFEIDPFPASLKDALDSMHMGHVERITFEFKERFWENLTKEPIGFIQGSPKDYFSTWWTQWPQHTPFLVAWQGGPKAFEIGHWPVEKQVKTALQTLSKLTGISERSLHQQLKGYHVHNWASDPYSQGAYSYLGMGADEKSGALRKPFENTLIFAGEATAEKSALATVHGAMHSGRRAARQALKILGNSKKKLRSPKKTYSSPKVESAIFS